MADDTTVIDKDDTTTVADDKAAATDKVSTADDKADDTSADAKGKTDDTAADWRSRMAGGDDKLLGFLGRYPTEKAFAEAAKKDREAARNGLKPLGADPTTEELAAYRKTFDVPEKPDGYLDKLSGGLVVGDDDKPIVNKFLESMHAANAPAAVTDAALQAYYKIVADQDATIAESVAAAKVQCEETLREEYGADYRRNTTAADAYLETQPAELQKAIGEGFNAAGIPLKSDPVVMQWLVGLALEANPLATVAPGTGANQATAVAEEIAKIEGIMRTNRPAYNRDEGMQARYRELVTARGKLKGG